MMTNDDNIPQDKEPLSKWTSVRLPTELYNQLKVHKDQTGIPVATAVRIAVINYLNQRPDERGPTSSK